MIFVTGDTHNTSDYTKILDFLDDNSRLLNKRFDYLIISGDFGAIWDQIPGRSERLLLDEYNNFPFITLFVDGNHENHDRLNKLPTAEMFGSEVGVVSDSVFHLKRGMVYTIEGNKIFTFGGGDSIDKNSRISYVSWWPEEMPSYAEYSRGLENLKEHDNKVDFIITHSAPSLIASSLGKLDEARDEKQLRKYFDEIKDVVQFDKWFFGHFHYDVKIDNKFQCLYQKIVRIT